MTDQVLISQNLALPNVQVPPPLINQLNALPGVSFLIPQSFVCPELSVAFWQARSNRAVMPMPKAPVDKNDLPAPSEY